MVLRLSTVDDMGRAPRWTLHESETLLTSDGAYISELAGSLPGRPTDAIEVVKRSIHAYHLGQDSSMLSQMIRDRLADSTRPVDCPICGSVVSC